MVFHLFMVSENFNKWKIRHAWRFDWKNHPWVICPMPCLKKKPEGNYGFHKFMLSIHVFFIFSLCSLFVDQLNDQTT